jgi:hypothetical protein
MLKAHLDNLLTYFTYAISNALESESSPLYPLNYPKSGI